LHKFLIHDRGDHVGVATEPIADGEDAVGVCIADDSTVEVSANGAVPLGHKIAIRAAAPGEPVVKYGIEIGRAPEGFAVGDYVHTHNLKSARW